MQNPGQAGNLDFITIPCYYVAVMKTLTHKVNKLLYNYKPGDFLPIYEDGQLSNRKQFVAYKVSRLAKGQLI